MMMPVEWPIAAPAAARPRSPARAARPGRLAAVRADFLIDDAHRLSEQERALMGALLAGLVDATLDEVLAMVPPIDSARIEPARQQIAERLWAEGALADEALIGLLLRRSDEQRLLAAGRRSAEGSGPVDQLVADPDEGIAVAAMALTVARGRRRDRFGRIGVELDDLDPPIASLLVHQLAAAARFALGAERADADEDFARAAERLLEPHDPAHSLDRLVMELAATLGAADRASPEAIEAFCREGEVALAAALMAIRAGIAQPTGWCLMTEDGPEGLMLLARLAGIDRAGAARLIATLGDALAITDPATAIAAFDRLAPEAVEAQRRWYRLPEAYRQAWREVGGDG